jgi:hypothetical protein
LTAVLTPGYAPLEQYSGEGRQGPWTDLYAFAGVLYRAVTNHAPPDAVSRLKADTVGAGIAAARGKYSEPFLRAVEWALAVDEKKRPQSVSYWQQALFPSAVSKAGRRRWPWVAAAAVLILALGVLALLKQRPDAVLEEKFAPQFRAADTNADGYLTPEEVRGRFPMIAKEFARVDSDNDGRISLREFLQVRRMQLERKK